MTLREVNRVGEGKKNVPKLRFKGYEDDWEQRKLGKVLDFSLKTNSLSRSMLNYEDGELKNIHYGDILMNYGPILDFKTETIPYITEEKVENFTSQLLMDGDVVFADAAEDESVGKAIEINGLEEQYLVAGLHTIVGRPVVKFAERFLGYYINSNSYHNQLLPLMQGTKVSSISKSTLQKTLIVYPKENNEQLKIGEFLNSLDNSITLHQRKYDALKTMKKTLLSKMFPKDGEDVPEIRFKGFTDAWEQRKAKQLFVSWVDKGYPDLPVLSATQDKGMVRRDENGINIHYDEKNKSGYKRVMPGQFVIHLRSFQGGFAYSEVEGITSPAYTVFDFKEFDKHIPEFWKYVFSSKDFIRRLEKVTYGIRDGRSIGFEDFLTLKFNVPEKREQKVIAEILAGVNNLITLHQRKLDELKNMKKTLLQQMFV